MHPRSETSARQLRDALAPYVSVRKLRQLAADNGAPLRAALLDDQPPADVLALLDALAALLRPLAREQISSPDDIAGLLLVEMSLLQQEQFRVLCLNTKNYVQAIHLVYQGSVNTAAVRLAEVFREPIRRNSAAIIVVHNHPSGDPTPSPEDVLLTRLLVETGRLLDVEVLDHLIIGQGRWISLRERRLGFTDEPARS